MTATSIDRRVDSRGSGEVTARLERCERGRLRVGHRRPGVHRAGEREVDLARYFAHDLERLGDVRDLQDLSTLDGLHSRRDVRQRCHDLRIHSG